MINCLARFFVNLATGKSQWEPPQAPALSAEGPPSEPPPSYNQAGPANPAAAAAGVGDKKTPIGSNNPYNPANAQNPVNPNMIDDDARLAAKLQAEEDARAGNRGPGTPGAAADYYSEPPRLQSTGGGYAPGPTSQSPAPEQKRSKGGFLSKLMGKSSGSSSRPRPQYASYPQQSGGYYGGYPQQPPHQPGYGYPPAGYGGYPPHSGYYPQQPPRRSGGMGTAGAAALGVGGGMLGGLLLADAVGDMGDHDYGDGGGFDGGGDFGGGDF